MRGLQGGSVKAPKRSQQIVAGSGAGAASLFKVRDENPSHFQWESMGYFIMYFSVAFVFKIGVGHYCIPALFQGSLVTGQRLLNFRRFRFGTICAPVSLGSQGLLPFLPISPSLCPHVTPEPCPASTQGFLFRESPKADPLLAFIPNGRCVRLQSKEVLLIIHNSLSLPLK